MAGCARVLAACVNACTNCAVGYTVNTFLLIRDWVCMPCDPDTLEVLGIRLLALAGIQSSLIIFFNNFKLPEVVCENQLWLEYLDRVVAILGNLTSVLSLSMHI